MFLGPAFATLIYVVAAIASASIESKSLNLPTGFYQDGADSFKANQDLSAGGAAWEKLAIYVCPLH